MYLLAEIQANIERTKGVIIIVLSGIGTDASSRKSSW